MELGGQGVHLPTQFLDEYVYEGEKTNAKRELQLENRGFGKGRLEDTDLE